MNDNATNENSAVRDVLAERLRQISEEGWTPEHDDQHLQGELANAAAAYAIGVSTLSGRVQDGKRFLPWHYRIWQWDLKWWKPTDRRRNLVKAGALLIAEIERLDRKAALHAKAGVSAEPVAWLRLGEPTPVQGVPFGANWITDKDDPLGFPVYAHQPASALSTKLQEPVAFDIDEYQQKRYDNGQPEDPTAYPDWKPDSECTQEPVGYIRKSAIKALKDTNTEGFEGVHTMVSRYPNKYDTEPLYTAPTLAHQPVTAGWEKEAADTLMQAHDFLANAVTEDQIWAEELDRKILDTLAALKSEGGNDE